MTDEITKLADGRNMTIRSPWVSETESLPLWQIVFVPSEGTWDDYPKFDGRTLGEAVEKAMAWRGIVAVPIIDSHQQRVGLSA